MNKQLNKPGPRQKGPIDAPPGSERLTARQIAIAQEQRRKGTSIGLISEQMGISKETIWRHTKGIKVRESNGGEAPKPPLIESTVRENNGKEQLPAETPKPSVFQIGVELDPDTMLRLAGTGSIQGFPTVKAYLNDYALPWLNSIKEAQALTGAKTPDEFLAKLNEIAKGYVTYQRMLDQAQKEVGKNVGTSERRENQPSQKN